jgi:hypothetical protein
VAELTRPDRGSLRTHGLLEDSFRWAASLACNIGLQIGI